MSVSPADSASQHGVSVPEVAYPGMCIVPPVFSEALVKKLSPKAASRYASQYMAAYQAFCRTYGSSSRGSRCGSRVSSGLNFGSVNSVDGSPSRSDSSGAGEQSDRDSAPAVSALDSAGCRGKVAASVNGLCYSSIVRPFVKDDLVSRLRKFPLLVDLLSMPFEEFLPYSVTSGFSISVVGDLCHIEACPAGVVGNLNAEFAMFALQYEFPFGSYGHSFKGKPYNLGLINSPSLSVDTVVGGPSLRGSTPLRVADGVVKWDRAVPLVESCGSHVQRSDLDLSVLAFDCEFVTATTIKYGTRSVLGRVSVVSFSGDTVYDAYVYHSELKIQNTNYKFGSGIEWKHLRPSEGARAFDLVRSDVLELFRSAKVVVGFAVEGDLKSLGLKRSDLPVLVDVQPKASGGPIKVSLKDAARRFLGASVQTGLSHSSVEDAVATVALWRALYGSASVTSTGCLQEAQVDTAAAVADKAAGLKLASGSEVVTVTESVDCCGASVVVADGPDPGSGEHSVFVPFGTVRCVRNAGPGSARVLSVVNGFSYRPGLAEACRCICTSVTAVAVPAAGSLLFDGVVVGLQGDVVVISDGCTVDFRNPASEKWRFFCPLTRSS